MKNIRNDAENMCPFYHKNHENMVSGKRKINRTGRPIEKSIYAEDVEEAADNLINCQDRDDSRQSCQSCKIVATLQKKSVEIYSAAREMA